MMTVWLALAEFYTVVVLIGGLLSISDIDRMWPYPMVPLICSIPLVWLPLIIFGS